MYFFLFRMQSAHDVATATVAREEEGRLCQIREEKLARHQMALDKEKARLLRKARGNNYSSEEKAEEKGEKETISEKPEKVAESENGPPEDAAGIKKTDGENSELQAVEVEPTDPTLKAEEEQKQQQEQQMEMEREKEKENRTIKPIKKSVFYLELVFDSPDVLLEREQDRRRWNLNEQQAGMLQVHSPEKALLSIIATLPESPVADFSHHISQSQTQSTHLIGLPEGESQGLGDLGGSVGLGGFDGSLAGQEEDPEEKADDEEAMGNTVPTADLVDCVDCIALEGEQGQEEEWDQEWGGDEQLCPYVLSTEPGASHVRRSLYLVSKGALLAGRRDKSLVSDMAFRGLFYPGTCVDTYTYTLIYSINIHTPTLCSCIPACT